VFYIPPADCLEQLDTLAQAVKAPCEQNHFFLPAGIFSVTTHRFYPARVARNRYERMFYPLDNAAD
jgi:hypothetical protein